MMTRDLEGSPASAEDLQQAALIEADARELPPGRVAGRRCTSAATLSAILGVCAAVLVASAVAFNRWGADLRSQAVAEGGSTDLQAVVAKPSAADDARPWYCHDYAAGQDDAWCAKGPVLGGMEFKLGEGDGTCGKCWCCARPLRSSRGEQYSVATHKAAGKTGSTQKLANVNITRDWYCHRYMDGQDEAWCKTNPVEHGLEYRYSAGDGTCGLYCFCCVRPAVGQSMDISAKVVIKSDVKAAHWFCYAYSSQLGHDDAWCEKGPVLGGLEFKLAKGDGTCGKCWCCTRPVQGSITSVQNTGTELTPYQAPEETASKNGWYCHDYAPGQNEGWCASGPVIRGSQYKLSQGDGSCGDCWCCAKMVEPNLTDVAIEVTTKNAASDWFCHTYADWQDDAWCKKELTLGGLEFKYSDGDGICGSCFCCARPAGKVELYSVETRAPGGLLSISGVPGMWTRNVGAGWRWNGFITKAEAFRQFLQHSAAQNPKKIIILLDTDMGYGGCSEQELLERYRKVSKASDGAPVVVGGDPWQYPKVAGLDEKVAKLGVPRRAAVFKSFGLKTNLWKALGARMGNDGGDYLQLNSGFIMGPAADVRDVIECALRTGWAWGSYDDQRAVTLCMLEDPQRITIDYTGTMAATLFHMPEYLMSFKDRKIHNNMANMTQCFLHSNGHTWPQQFHWYDWINTVSRSFESVTA